MKVYLNSVEELQSLYSDYENVPSQDKEEIRFYKGRIYTKVGTKSAEEDKLSFYIFKQEMTTSVEGLSQKSVKKIHDFIFEKHLPYLKNLEVENPPLLVYFSGTFCMGKTTISKKIEDGLKGIRINADQIRTILKANFLPKEIVEDYIVYCLSKLKEISPNHLIILDRAIALSIYGRYQALSKLYGIKLIVSKEVVEERIKTREHEIHNTDFFLENLPKSWKRYEDFNEQHSFDYTLDNNAPNDEDLRDLFESIRSAMQH